MMSSQKRLLSLDALRGFDMLFIMGGEACVMALANLCAHPCLEPLKSQMVHAEWDGFTFYDLIFPLFLFIAGVAFPFSLAKNEALGESKVQISQRIVKRGLTLILLGVVYNGLLNFDFENLRYASVLGRIGSAWMLASLLFLWTSRRVSLYFGCGLLLCYWFLLMFTSAPDYPGASPFSMEGSIVGYVDRLLLPGRLHLGIHDPEGLLSTLPAIVTALMGIFTGIFVRECNFNGHKKAGLLFLAGFAGVVIGYLWDGVCPVNKNLWTPSFVCVAGGYSAMLFALFYWIIDVLQWQRWTFFFRVIGVNSITIYLAQKFFDVGYPIKTVFGGVLSIVPQEYMVLTYWLAYVAVCWAFLYFLYRHKIFLKV